MFSLQCYLFADSKNIRLLKNLRHLCKRLEQLQLEDMRRS